MFLLFFTISYALSTVVTLENGQPFDVEGTLKAMKAPKNRKNIFKEIYDGLFLLLKCLGSFFYILSLTITGYDSDILFTDRNKKNLIMKENKKTIIFPTLKLNFVKELKTKAKVTVNDILFTISSGAIRRYCLANNDPLFTPKKDSNVQTRSLLPVAFPRPKKHLNDPSMALRNKWSFVR